MINSNSQLRAAARADLKGRWAEAAMLTFVSMLIAIFVTSMGSVADTCVFGPKMLYASTDLSADALLAQQSSGIFSMLVSLLIIPMGWSFDMTFLANHRHESDDPFGVGNLFTGYRQFWRVFATQVLVTLLVFLFTLLLFIPGIWMALRLAMAPFILRDHPEMSISDVLRQSVRMMDGYKCKYLLLQLSFLGWILLCIPTLGIGLLWVVPYIGQTQANFYEQLCAECAVEKQA